MTDIASQPSAMDAIGDAYWEEALRLNPTAATVYGDERYNHLLPDPSAAGRRAEIDAVRRASGRASAASDARRTASISAPRPAADGSGSRWL